MVRDMVGSSLLHWLETEQNWTVDQVLPLREEREKVRWFIGKAKMKQTPILEVGKNPALQ